MFIDLYIAVVNHWRRYLVSSLITFLAGASLVLLNEMNHLTLETFKDGSWVGLLFIVVRGGVKTVLEVFVAWYQNFKQLKNS